MKVVSLAETVQLRVEEDGAGLLFDAESGSSFALNDTGVWLWQQLTQEIRGLSALLRCAQEQYSIPATEMPDVAEQVVIYLLELHAKKLVGLEVAGRELG